MRVLLGQRKITESASALERQHRREVLSEAQKLKRPGWLTRIESTKRTPTQLSTTVVQGNTKVTVKTYRNGTSLKEVEE